MESISMPRKVIVVEGSITLFQLIWKPSFLSSYISIFIALRQSAKVSGFMKKSCR